MLSNFQFHQIGIKHYAGPVVYQTEGFISKNLDVATPDVSEVKNIQKKVSKSSTVVTDGMFSRQMLQTSSNAIIAKCFPNSKNSTIKRRVRDRRSASVGISNIPSTKVASPVINQISYCHLYDRSISDASMEIFLQQISWILFLSSQVPGNQLFSSTVASQFRTQLRELHAAIIATNIHYVRCVKPNNSASPLKFDAEKVVNQLRSLGENIRDFYRARDDCAPSAFFFS